MEKWISASRNCRSKMSAFLRLFSETGTPRRTAHILRLTLWNVPTTPRLKIDQKPSIVFV